MANQTCAERKQIAKNYEEGTVWKVSIFGVFLVRIFPHSPNAGKYDQKSSEYGDFSRSRIVWKIFSCVLRLWCCSKFWIQPYFDSNQKNWELPKVRKAPKLSKSKNTEILKRLRQVMRKKTFLQATLDIHNS